MTDTQPFMDEAANLFWQIAKDAPTADENGDACWSVSVARDIISTALSSAYQRGREDGREDEREIVAKWMIARSLATGHGDTTESLLDETEAQIMARAAKIAGGNSAEFDFGKALAECRDSEYGFHSGRLHAATAIRTERDKG